MAQESLLTKIVNRKKSGSTPVIKRFDEFEVQGVFLLGYIFSFDQKVPNVFKTNVIYKQSFFGVLIIHEQYYNI